MIITGQNSEQLLVNFPNTLGNLFALAQRALDEKPKFQNAIIAADGLYIKKDDGSGYLVVSPEDHRLFNADPDLQPIEIYYEISIFAIEAAAAALENILNSQTK